MDVKLQAQKALEGLTYVCTDALLLEDINKKLEGVMADMQSTLADGLVIRPAIKERIKQTKGIVSQLDDSLCTSFPFLPFLFCLELNTSWILHSLVQVSLRKQ